MRITYSDNETVALTSVSDSAFIKKMNYNFKAKILIIQFNSKSVWAYGDIDKKMFDSMIKSDSVGGFFNKNIRSKKRCVQILKHTKDGLVQVASSEALMPVRKLEIK